MKAILVNIALVPLLSVAVPLVLVLSLIPGSHRVKALRRRIVDWLDQITNDYGAELIYLTDRVPTNDEATVPHSVLTPALPECRQSKLIIVRSRRTLPVSQTTRRH